MLTKVCKVSPLYDNMTCDKGWGKYAGYQWMSVGLELVEVRSVLGEKYLG